MHSVRGEGTSRPHDAQGTLGAAARHPRHGSAIAPRSRPQ
jgi:hypothetical protein